MHTISRRLILLLSSLFAAGNVMPADAHPVAQGALEIRVLPGRVEARARVSVEEVFVASTFSTSPGSAAAGTLEEVWRSHGDYLLAHFRVFADGQPLVGQVLAVTPPPSSDPDARVTYEFTYPLADADKTPARLRLEEDVLREFTYAPGNAWTASYVVRVEQPGRATTIDALLLDRNQNLEIPLAAATDKAPAAGTPARIDHARVFREYVVHGLWHILTGYDHMLFMAALALAAVTLWDLVKVVSVFTLAHTITLTLSVLNLVRVSERIVEPMIAASIVFVALQNILAPSRTRGWSRLAIVFGFGLFHGLGFAGGLLEAMSGLPSLAIATAIAAFSIGVEIGHQCVVLPIFGAVRLAESLTRQPIVLSRPRIALERYGSMAISAAGTFYLVVALRVS